MLFGDGGFFFFFYDCLSSWLYGLSFTFHLHDISMLPVRGWYIQYCPWQRWIGCSDGARAWPSARETIFIGGIVKFNLSYLLSVPCTLLHTSLVIEDSYFLLGSWNLDFCHQVKRVLKSSGKFICLTLAESHVLGIFYLNVKRILFHLLLLLFFVVSL